jgi:hypothetical protein
MEDREGRLMARFNVTSPDGQKFVITAPDDATPDQVMEYAQSQFKAPEAKPSATDGMSGVETLRAGIGRGLTAAGRAAAGFLGNSPLGDVNRAIHSVLPAGIPGRLPTAAESEAARMQAAKEDAALLQTRGGKVGNVIGSAAAAAPALLIPGANTYVGASLIGAGTGAVTTEGNATERAQGALFGGLGGLAGKAAGDAIGGGVRKLREYVTASREAGKAANAGRDAAVATARDAGYVLPPTEARPSALNSLLEGISGKIKTSQAAATRNQSVTNRLAKQAVGAADDVQLSPEALKAIRDEAGKAYQAVASSGTITPGPRYAQALDAIVADAKQAAKDFPGSKPSSLVSEVEALRSGQFDAASAVAKIRTLREDASAAYAQGDKALGKGLKDGAKALEEAIEEHLKTAGPELLKQFRDARQLIAKTYSVEGAMNKATGDVSAPALAAMLKRGKPLSGELQQIAEVGAAFPKATQSLSQNYGALSPLDYLAAIGTQNPLVALARPGIRSTILSQPYQAAFARQQNYEPAMINRLAQLLENDYARRLTVSGAAGAALPASQQ